MVNTGKGVCLSGTGLQDFHFNFVKFKMTKTHPCENITMQLEVPEQFSELNSIEIRVVGIFMV